MRAEFPAGWRAAGMLVAAVGLAACTGKDSAGGAPAPAPAPEELPPPAFVEVAARTGLAMTHFTGATGEYYFPEIMGSGVALFDYDLDGDLDVYAVQSGYLAAGAGPDALVFPQPSEHWPGNRLFRNELVPGGVLAFTDVTEASGAGDAGYGMGVSVGDIDADGDPDLYVTNFGDDVLLRNDGDGRFTDITATSGLSNPDWGTGSAFLDYDRDGDLDLFVTQYVTFTMANNIRCASASGQRDYCDPTTYRPLPDRLWRNEGDGRYTDVSQAAGLRAAYGNGLGVAVADFDGDGWPDVYVANDKLANQLWINGGDGRFTDTALLSGAAYNADGLAEAGMGVTAGDPDADGDEDLFVTHLRGQTNTLYLNDGAGGFSDDTNRLGLGVSSLRFTGFGAHWFDCDNDGLLDLFVANGAVIIEPDQAGADPYPYRQTNQLFANRGDAGFVDISASAGAPLALKEVSRGAAFGDIDNDGDIDILVSNNNGPLRLYLNELGQARHWLRVRLIAGPQPATVLGARVALLRGGRPVLWRRVHSDGSYLSASDERIVLGLGEQGDYDGIGVVWPDGEREQWPGQGRDLELRLVRGEGEPWPVPGSR